MNEAGSFWQQFRRGFVDGIRSAGSSRQHKVVAGIIGGMVGVGYIVALG